MKLTIEQYMCDSCGDHLWVSPEETFEAGFANTVLKKILNGIIVRRKHVAMTESWRH